MHIKLFALFPILFTVLFFAPCSSKCDKDMTSKSSTGKDSTSNALNSSQENFHASPSTFSMDQSVRLEGMEQ